MVYELLSRTESFPVLLDFYLVNANNATNSSSNTNNVNITNATTTTTTTNSNWLSSNSTTNGVPILVRVPDGLPRRKHVAGRWLCSIGVDCVNTFASPLYDRHDHYLHRISALSTPIVSDSKAKFMDSTAIHILQLTILSLSMLLTLLLTLTPMLTPIWGFLHCSCNGVI